MVRVAIRCTLQMAVTDMKTQRSIGDRAVRKAFRLRCLTAFFLLHAKFQLNLSAQGEAPFNIQQYSLHKEGLKISQHCASGKTLASSYNLILSTEIM